MGKKKQNKFNYPRTNSSGNKGKERNPWGELLHVA